jgi:hypothetical protein
MWHPLPLFARPAWLSWPSSEPSEGSRGARTSSSRQAPSCSASSQDQTRQDQTRSSAARADRLGEPENPGKAIAAPKKSLPSYQVSSPRAGSGLIGGRSGSLYRARVVRLRACGTVCNRTYGCARQSTTRPSTFRWRHPAGVLIYGGRGLPTNVEDFLIGLALSGGGVHAAIFSYGVLLEFDRTPIRSKKTTAPLLDRIDFL